MSDFTNKPVKLCEEEVLNNCAKMSYETININWCQSLDLNQMFPLELLLISL